MYDKKSDFEAEIKSLEGVYRSQMPKWYHPAQTWGGEIDHAWLLYSNARSNDLGMLILGGEELRSDKDLLANFGTTAAAPAQNESQDTTFKPGVRPSAKNKTGSVLKEKYWWPMMNDAWVLGGIHGLSEFHLATASPDSVTNAELWEGKLRRARVLGREMIGLSAFGYKRAKNNFEALTGVVYVAASEDKAKAATFTQYLRAIANVFSASVIRASMK